MANFVAVSRIEHGHEDGKRTVLEPGESVESGTFTEGELSDFYAAGSITVAGAKDDPNTWEDSFPAGQTPATVEASLRDLARLADGPNPSEEATRAASLLDPGVEGSTATGAPTSNDADAPDLEVDASGVASTGIAAPVGASATTAPVTGGGGPTVSTSTDVDLDTDDEV